MLFLGLTLTSLGLMAQDKEDDKENGPDSTKKDDVEVITFPSSSGKIELRFYPNEDSTKQKEHKPKKDEPRDFWSGIDFGFNGYLNKDMGTAMPTGFERFETDLGKSTYFGFNLYELGIPLYRNNVVLVTGLGIDYNNYRFKADYNPFSQPDSTGAYATKDYITNRLKTFYATMPLMLGFDFSKPDKKGLHLALGVVGGVRFASYTKEKFTTDNTKVKTNTKSDYDLNPFRLNAQARLGYGNFTVFASYAMTEMFQNSATRPELYPYTIGISFGG